MNVLALVILYCLFLLPRDIFKLREGNKRVWFYFMTCWFEVMELNEKILKRLAHVKSNKNKNVCGSRIIFCVCIKCNYQRFTVYIMYMVEQDGMMYPTYGYRLDLICKCSYSICFISC